MLSFPERVLSIINNISLLLATFSRSDLHIASLMLPDSFFQMFHIRPSLKDAKEDTLKFECVVQCMRFFPSSLVSLCFMDLIPPAEFLVLSRTGTL